MKKLHSYLLLCSLALAVCSCNPLRQMGADPQGGKQDGDWWSVKTDTIVRERTEYVIYDGQVIEEYMERPPADVERITVEEEGVTTTVDMERADTVVRWRIRTVVQPDSILVNCTDTVFIREKPPPLIPVFPPVPEGAPGWMHTAAFVIGMLGFLVAIILALRNKKQK